MQNKTQMMINSKDEVIIRQVLKNPVKIFGYTIAEEKLKVYKCNVDHEELNTLIKFLSLSINNNHKVSKICIGVDKEDTFYIKKQEVKWFLESASLIKKYLESKAKLNSSSLHNDNKVKNIEAFSICKSIKSVMESKGIYIEDDGLQYTNIGIGESGTTRGIR